MEIFFKSVATGRAPVDDYTLKNIQPALLFVCLCHCCWVFGRAWFFFISLVSEYTKLDDMELGVDLEGAWGKKG